MSFKFDRLTHKHTIVAKSSPILYPKCNFLRSLNSALDFSLKICYNISRQRAQKPQSAKKYGTEFWYKQWNFCTAYIIYCWRFCCILHRFAAQDNRYRWTSHNNCSPLFQKLPIGVVEAASSSLVTQTKWIKPLIKPIGGFFLYLCGFSAIWFYNKLYYLTLKYTIFLPEVAQKLPEKKSWSKSFCSKKRGALRRGFVKQLESEYRTV